MAIEKIKKKGSWGKKLGIVFAVLVVLLITVYFVATSEAFIKGFILPKANAALNSTVTVDSISLSPFSSVEIKNLKVVPNGKEQLLQAETVRAHYHLMDIIKGNINVDEVTLEKPIITLVQTSTGSNLDPILKQSSSAPSDNKPTQQKKQMVFNVRNVSIKNGQLERRTETADGSRGSEKLSNLNVNLDLLNFSQPGKLTVDTAFEMDRSPAAKDTNSAPSQLSGNLKSDFQFQINANFKPVFVKGTTALDLPKASGALKDLAGLNVALNTDLSPTEIKGLLVDLKQGSANLGQIKVSGPFSADKMEGKLNFQLLNLDRALLNVATAGKGLDFNKTRINSTNVIDIAQGAKQIGASGSLVISDMALTLRAKNQTTPALDITANYSVDVNQTAQTVLIKQFTVEGRQNTKTILTASISKPMTLSLGDKAGAPDEATLQANVQNFNLADWKTFLGDAATGTLETQLSAVSKKGGQELQFDLKTDLRNASAVVASNKIDNASAHIEVNGVLTELKKVSLQKALVSLAQGTRQALKLEVSGTADTTSQNANLKVDMDADMAVLTSVVKQNGTSLSSGSTKFAGTVIQSNSVQKVAGRLTLANVSGMVASNRLDRFEAVIDTDLTISTNKGVQELQFGVKSDLRLASATVASNQIENAAAHFEVVGNLGEMKKLALQSMLLTLSQGSRQAMKLEASGTADTATQNADIKVALDADMPVLTSVVKLNGTSFSSGSTKFAGNFSQTNSAQKIVGQLSMLNLSGTLSSNKLDRFEATIDTDVASSKTEVLISKLHAVFKQAGVSAGNIDATGSFKQASQVAQGEFKIDGLNQNLIAPFANSALNGKQLASILINGNGKVSGTMSNMQVNADVSITNIVVKDLKDPKPPTPLAVSLLVDGSKQGDIFTIKTFGLTLSPTARAKNQLTLSGQLDMTKTNAITGKLTARADSLDLTPYYDLFAGKSPKEVAASGKPTSDTPATSAQVSLPKPEPEPMKLPVQLLSCELNFAKVFLREIEITDLKSTLRIETNHAVLRPFQLSLNNAPVTADIDVDLSKKGYGYAVSFLFNKVPLEPIANSFVADKSGQYKGEIFANAKFTSIGLTDLSLKKTANAQVYFTFTNANIQIVSPRLKTFLTPIATAINAPEILDSPVNWVTAALVISNANITLGNFGILSEAFYANTVGTIPMADILTNSPVNEGVSFQLRRSIAAKAKLIGNESYKDQKYVSLPTFVKVQGTIGKPESKIDYAGLAKLALQVTAENSNLLKGSAGSVVNQFLGGGQAAAPPGVNNSPATNAGSATPPQSKASSAVSILKGFLPASTNSPSTTATNAPASGVNQLLDLFNRPKK
ncbi:MAG: hypothetical protein JWN25_1311 [Verrucomicrobiales bacterium]|nr:hypothetical protein [Verrucomicrobiales bacterium]